MIFYLFLFFSIIPVVEIAILIKIGSYIGVTKTIIVVILTAVIGAYLVKREGLSVIGKLRKKIQEGKMPGEELFDGVMILIAGALLLTPGFTTDVVGFLLVFPASRQLIKQVVKQYIERKFFSLPTDTRHF